jgi:hypothetical protein
MPLTDFQHTLLADLAQHPTDQRYLAGGAAIHFAPNSTRYSDDLDFFHDSEQRVAIAFAEDRAQLERLRYTLEIEFSLPGMVRAMVRRGPYETRVDWAHDSAWRFLPLVRDPLGGLLLDPIDLAINKVLALAGRNEARDFVDTLFVHARVLSLTALCWAAPGKDPGLSPLSLLELLNRRGRYHEEDFERLQLTEPFDLARARREWLGMLEAADSFAKLRPPEELGCLYYSHADRRFVVPRPDITLDQQHVSLHFGRPGGVVPRVASEQA